MGLEALLGPKVKDNTPLDAAVADAGRIGEGEKIGCFQARPPFSVMIGAMTFTSCAMQAILTTFDLRMKVFRMQPTCSTSSKL